LFRKPRRYLIGQFRAVPGHGLGNVVFEIISFIGIAQVTGRIPVISPVEGLYANMTYERLLDVSMFLPHLTAGILFLDSSKVGLLFCANKLQVLTEVGDVSLARPVKLKQISCCRVASLEPLRKLKGERLVLLQLYYMQVFPPLEYS